MQLWKVALRLARTLPGFPRSTYMHTFGCDCLILKFGNKCTMRTFQPRDILSHVIREKSSLSVRGTRVLGDSQPGVYNWPAGASKWPVNLGFRVRQAVFSLTSAAWLRAGALPAPG